MHYGRGIGRDARRCGQHGGDAVIRPGGFAVARIDGIEDLELRALARAVRVG